MIDLALTFLVTFGVMVLWALAAFAFAFAYRVLVDWITTDLLPRHAGRRHHT